MTVPEPRRELHLTVRTPSGTVVDAPVWSVNAEDHSGRFGLRPGVEPLVAALVPTVLEYRDLEGETRFVAVHRGALRASRDAVHVSVRKAIPCASLDEVRAILIEEAQAERSRTREARRAFRSLYRRLYATLIEEERAR